MLMTLLAVASAHCFLLHEVRGGEARRTGADCARATSPASTFKIPHAVLALEAQVVRPDEPVQNPPERQRVAEWNRPHTLASAIRASAVWYFQRTARLIGQPRMQAWLDAIHYGNRDTSAGLDVFWLGRSLKITPEEQLALLRFFARELPASATNLSIVEEALRQAPGTLFAGGRELRLPWREGAALWGKSGWTGPGGTSWYVGQLQTGGKRYVFVSRIEPAPHPTDAADLAVRELREAGLLDR
jgi:beta-lactamase class D